MGEEILFSVNCVERCIENNEIMHSLMLYPKQTQNSIPEHKIWNYKIATRKSLQPWGRSKCLRLDTKTLSAKNNDKILFLK
jgi:hypothetical protein